MHRSRTVWPMLGLVLLAVALAVVAAGAGGPWTLSDRGGLWGSQPLPRMAPPPNDNPAPLGGRPARSLLAGQPPAWLTWAMLIMVALSVALVTVVVWRRISQWLHRREAAPVEEFDLPGEVRPDAPVIRAGLTSALDELSVTANPTDAVLRAWVAIENAADRSGVPRKPSDTPTEFTARVLGATRADRESVQDLLHLYHQARFSWHGLSSADRERARHCLQGLAGSWSAFEEREARTGGTEASETRPVRPGGRG